MNFLFITLIFTLLLVTSVGQSQETFAASDPFQNELESDNSDLDGIWEQVSTKETDSCVNRYFRVLVDGSHLSFAPSFSCINPLSQNNQRYWKQSLSFHVNRKQSSVLFLDSSGEVKPAFPNEKSWRFLSGYLVDSAEKLNPEKPNYTKRLYVRFSDLASQTEWSLELIYDSSEETITMTVVSIGFHFSNHSSATYKKLAKNIENGGLRRN